MIGDGGLGPRLNRAALVLAWSVALPCSPIAQGRPDFSGTWLLDIARSGREPTIWTQRRPSRFVFTQTADELTLDTGDGSLFGVPALVIDGSLRYRFDGAPVVVVDRSLGDLPGFARKIRTWASWDGTHLITRATQFSQTAQGESRGVTRVLVFSLTPDRGTVIVERTGYRGEAGPELFVGTLPKIPHHGRIEDDLVYATDTALYTRRQE
jgi:hypothetical protein